MLRFKFKSYNFTGQVPRRVHRVGRALPRAADGLWQRGVRVRRGRLLRRRLHLLGAEGGVSLGSGLGSQARVKHAVAREAVGDGKDGKYGGAQVHSHCRRRGIDAERGMNCMKYLSSCYLSYLVKINYLMSTISTILLHILTTYRQSVLP